jgi:heme/copper-type cytochrome/quinol oxidase subunit 2
MEGGMQVTKQIIEEKTKRTSFLQYCLFVLWTVIVVGIFVLSYRHFYSPEMFSGTEINIATSSDYNLVISATSPVTANADSSNFFLLRNQDEYIIGLPKAPPLNWKSREYYNSDAKVISPGDWIFVNGEAELHFSSSEAMTIAEVLNSDQADGLFVITLLIGLIFWGLFGFAIILKKK